jgi:predicted RNase H-like HicB family nuclease
MSPKAQPGIAPKRESQPNITPRKYMRLTAVFVEIPGGGYMGYVEELPGANTEGTTLEETRENLQDAVNEMMLADRELTEELIEAEANREFTKEVISELSLTGRVHREELLLPAAA